LLKPRAELADCLLSSLLSKDGVFLKNPLTRLVTLSIECFEPFDMEVGDRFISKF
jgi:hypothetical protein